MRSLPDRPTARPPVRALLGAALALAALLATSCVDGDSPLGPTDGAPVLQFALTYESYGSVAAAPQPINRIRATVVDAASGAVLGTPQVFDVDASQPSWDVPVKVDIRSGGSRQIRVVLELIHVDASGGETIEWSGRTGALTVTGQTGQTVQQVSVYRGPPQNLDVTAVVITDPPRTRMVEGETLPLDAAVQGGGAAQLFWSTLTPTLVSISDDGRVTALLPGQARVVAAAGPKADTLQLSVLQRLAGVELSPATLELDAVGETGTIQATAVDPRGAAVSGVTITWSVAEPRVAEHLGGGLFAGLRNGSTPVTVSAVRNDPVAAAAPALAQDTAVRAAGMVVVSQAVDVLDVRPASMAFSAVGDAEQAGANAFDPGGTPVQDPVVDWRSRNTSVATVTGDGVVRSTGNGTTWIVATSGSAADSLQVTVSQVAVGLTLTPALDTLRFRGETVQLTVTVEDANGVAIPGPSVSFSSNATSVASVNGSGLVTAGDEGVAVITATSGAFSDASTIVVAPVVGRIDVLPETIRLSSLAETAPFRAVLLDGGGDTLRTRTPIWTVSDPAVATVDASGTATPLKPGTVQVTASADGVSDSGTLIIEQSVQTVDAQPDSLVFTAVGQTGRATARVLDEGGRPVAGATATWLSRNRDVATVDADGNVAATGIGLTWLVASADGASDSVKVRVAPVVARVAVTPSSNRLVALRQTVQLTATAYDGADNLIPGRTATFSSSATSTAAVSPTGLVTAVANGTATITATIDGVNGTAAVTVAQEPGGVRVVPTSATIPANGGRTTLAATVVDALGSVVPGASVAWSSSDDAVAGVASSGPLTGTVTGGVPGTALVTARASNGASGSAAITVEATEAVAVDVRPDTVRVNWGDEAPLSAVALAEGGFDTNLPADAEVLWISRNETIASVEGGADATVFGASVGSTWVVAVVSGEAYEWTDSARVVVTQGPPAEVVVAPAADTAVLMSDYFEYTATVYDAFEHQIDGEVAWSIADPTVARFATVGAPPPAASVLTGYPNSWTYLEAVGNGETTLTATFTSGGVTVQGSGQVVVDVPVDFLFIETYEGTIFLDGVGETWDLGAATTAYDAQENPIGNPGLAWSSDDTDVVTVDAVTGVVTSVGGGETYVRATAPSGATFQVYVVVNSYPAYVEILAPVFRVIDVGASANFYASVLDQNGDPMPDYELTWELDHDSEVAAAALSASGVGEGGAYATLTGLAPGATYLLASDGGFTGGGSSPAGYPEYISGPVDVGAVAVLGPTSLFSTAWVGGSPKTVVTPGQTITVPVTLDMSRASANGDLGSVELEVEYDPDVLTFIGDASPLGGSALWESNGDELAGGEGYLGLYRFAMAATTAQGSSNLVLVELTFQVASGLPGVGSAGVSLSEGYFVTSVDVHYTDDPSATDLSRYDAPVTVDGLILIDDGDY